MYPTTSNRSFTDVTLSHLTPVGTGTFLPRNLPTLSVEDLEAQQAIRTGVVLLPVDKPRHIEILRANSEVSSLMCIAYSSNSKRILAVVSAPGWSYKSSMPGTLDKTMCWLGRLARGPSGYDYYTIWDSREEETLCFSMGKAQVAGYI